MGSRFDEDSTSVEMSTSAQRQAFAVVCKIRKAALCDSGTHLAFYADDGKEPSYDFDYNSVDRPTLTMTACDEGASTLCELASTVGRSESVEFDYDALDAGPAPTPRELGNECACEMMRQLAEWLYQPKQDFIDMHGLNCRALILCHLFVPELRSSTMSKMAGNNDKKKQSLGRWITDFKQTFPQMTAYLAHMKHDGNCSCK